MPDLKNVKLPAPFGGFGDEGDGGFGFVASTTGGPRANFLRFNGKSGVYTLNGEPVAPGMRYIVGKATVGWVRLSAGERAERVYQKPGKPRVRREDLPDRDPKLWGSFGGQPKDPWGEEVALYCANPESGDMVIFTIMSESGRNAVSDLCRLIDFQQRQQGPNAYPIVEFGVGSFDGAYGITPVPKFTIIGWINGAPELPPSKAPDATAELEKRSTIDPKATRTGPQPSRRKPEPPRPKPPDVPWEDELDDEIPL